jgi:hypothetical protein
VIAIFDYAAVKAVWDDIERRAALHVYEHERCAPRVFVFDYHFAQSLIEHDDGERALLAAQIAVMDYDRSTLQ